MDNSSENQVQPMTSGLIASERTIEEELGLQQTKVDLGLQDEAAPVLVGRDQRFRVSKLLGRGSMGAVYLAYDVVLKCNVALKVVAPHRLERAHLELRLEREAQALASLNHPNVLGVFDLATTGAGELYIAMKYVEGSHLGFWRKETQPSFDEILDVYLEAGQGLVAAHRKGIVHRDFKPDNVLIEHKDGRRVLVGDFGLAAFDQAAEDDQPSTTERTLTSPKGLLGTLAYMAPEQLNKEPADARSDQHQFCVSLWEAVSGEKPFPRDKGRALEPSAKLPPRPPAIPRWLYRILERGLAYEREHRYKSMSDLLTALRRGRWFWRRAFPTTIVSGLLAAAATVVGVAITPGPCDGAADAMAGVWNDDTRDMVRTAIGATNEPYAGNLASYVVGGIDGVEREWTARSVEACEAPRPADPKESADFERRKLCLDSWVHRTSRVVELLGGIEPGSDAFNRAHRLVDDLKWTGRECQLPPAPIEPSVREKLQAAEYEQLLGHTDVAIARATEGIELAEGLDVACQPDGTRDSDGRAYSHELAAAFFRLGYIQRVAGNVEGALESLEKSRQHALACGDERRQAESQIHTAKVLSMYAMGLDEADAAWSDATVVLDRIEDPETTPRRFDQSMAAGLIAAARRRYEEARTHYGHSLDVLGDPRDYPVKAAKIYHNIGITYQDEGNSEEAQKADRKAVRIVADAFGEGHPVSVRIAKEKLSMALRLAEEGRLDQARDILASIVDFEEPIVVVKALTAWVQLEHQTEDLASAVARASTLLEHIEQYPGMPPELVAQGKAVVGMAFSADDVRRTQGHELLNDAISYWRSTHDINNLSLTRIMLIQALHIAEMHVERDDEIQSLCCESSNFSEDLQAFIDDALGGQCSQIQIPD